MERLSFDDSGKLIAIDESEIETPKKEYPSQYPRYQKKKYFGSYPKKEFRKNIKLKTSESLSFLKDEYSANKMESIFDRAFWSLYSENKPLEPLKFSNGKSQEDVVKEVVELIKSGNKVIFLKGACGTGKSVIALNIARVLGRTSVIVPVKNLQKQYEEDYMEKKYLLKPNGKKMKIAVLTGRENHDCVIKPGISCADHSLPENIKILSKNYIKLVEYYNQNPYISQKSTPELKQLKRISIAPANPYWSPIIPADFEVPLRDARKKKYMGANGKEYIFYHRKEGCSYYDQYLSYMSADVIIFNAAKYLAEMSIGRKPETAVEIIDEADEFLDGLFQQEELNITRLISALRMIIPDSISAIESRNKIIELLELEEKNKRILGIDENDIFHIKDTKLKEIFAVLLKNSELQSEIAIDEQNYSNRLLESARSFEGYIDDIFMTFKKDEENNLYTKLVSTNLSAKFKDILDKSKAIVLMSGTLHSENVLKNIFGILDYKTVEAEMLNFGSIEVIQTGKEFDCKYSNLSSNKHSREDYLKSLLACIEKAQIPALVQVHAFKDLPTEAEKSAFFLGKLVSSENLAKMQGEDKMGLAVSLFKKGLSDFLFTTKCSRGVDFPGDMCKSVIFTKYPNPNISDTFWKILQKTHKAYFWDFYKDKAQREFLQRIYRALRSKDDHVFVLSPDIRVLEAVKELQKNLKAQKANPLLIKSKQK